MNVDLINVMGSDLSVVNAARVSYGKQSKVLNDKDIKLIGYLAKHNHWSPFSHTSLTFHIKAPIFVARQLGKHQVGLSWNEISRRYVDYEPEFYEPYEWRDKPTNSKQGSGGKSASQYFPNLYLKDVTDLAKENYRKMIIQGVAPEMARMILPQSMYTEWYWTGSLYAFARVCKLRLAHDTQFETRVIANEIRGYCSESFKHSWKALMADVDLSEYTTGTRMDDNYEYFSHKLGDKKE